MGFSGGYHHGGGVFFVDGLTAFFGFRGGGVRVRGVFRSPYGGGVRVVGSARCVVVLRGVLSCEVVKERQKSGGGLFCFGVLRLRRGFGVLRLRRRSPCFRPYGLRRAILNCQGPSCYQANKRDITLKSYHGLSIGRSRQCPSGFRASAFVFTRI